LFDHPRIAEEPDVQTFYKILFWVAEVFLHVSAQDLDLSLIICSILRNPVLFHLLILK